MGLTIDEASDDDLKAELARRKEVKNQEEIQRRGKRAEFILQNIDSFISCCPEHSRTSCSDTNLCNLGRCTRCTLMIAKNDDYIDWDYDIELYLVKLDPIT